MKRNIVTAFASIIGSRVVRLIAMAAITPLLVRLLEPRTYGQYATLMAVFGLLMIVISSGINTGTRKFLAEERPDDAWRDHVFGFYFRLAAVFAAVVAIGLVVAARSGLVTTVLGPQYAGYFYLLAVLTVAAQFRSYVRRALMGLKMEHLSEPIRILDTVAFGVTALALVWLGYGIAGVLVGHILSSVLVIVVSAIVLSRYISLSAVFEPVPSGFPRRELFDFNSLTVVNMLLLLSLNHVDVLMLEVFGSSEQVGYYRAALVLAQLLWVVPRAIQSVMVQSTSDLWEKGATDRITQIASRTSRYTLLFTALLTLGLGALATEFVPLYYGDAYRPSITPVLLLLPGTLGFALARPIFAISNAQGNLKPLIAATGATATINFLLNLLLIPAFGMQGAAVATSIGYGSLPVFHIVAARHLGYQPLDDLRLGRVALTVAAGSVPIFLLATALESPLLSFLLVPPTGMVFYATFAVLTGAVDLEELFEVAGALPAPLDRKAAALKDQLRSADGSISALL